MNFTEILRSAVVGGVAAGLVSALFALPGLRNTVGKGAISKMALVAAIVAVLMVNALFPHPGLNAEIVETCEKITATCPMQVDQVTKLTSCTAGDMHITYNYVVSCPVTPEQAKQLQAAVASQAKNKLETKRLLDLGITMTYQYSGEKGQDLAHFDVSSQSQP